MSAPASALVIDGTHVAADPAAAEALLCPICADARIRSHSEHFRFRRRATDHFDANLISSSPTETTVAAIARRWGFVHLSRFAQRYHAEFGEQPSETLRR